MRDAEQISRRIAVEKVRKKERAYDPDILALEEEVSTTLGTRVRVEPTGLGGRIMIDYFSPDDIRKILALLNAKEESTEAQAPSSTETSLAHETAKEPEAAGPGATKEAGTDDDLYSVTNFSL